MFVCPECGYAKGAPGFCTEHGTALVDAGEDSLLGQRVGSYRVARLIGEGGMGRVYLAVQPEIGSRVALKVLTGDAAAGSASVERFFAEARAVNVIRHENIVSVLDLSRLPDGRPYIVMEYLEGAPLSTLIARRGALPLGALTRALGEVLDALGAAHEKGIVHRDLKPDNIFITRGGHAKVLDFGIAKLKPELGAMDAQTRTGALMGTPHYMSPEQALGRPADPRSDLYAVGVILFEGATGRRPFDAGTLYELLKQHVEHAPPSPRTMRGDLPHLYEALILRALDKDPARRFQSARELSAALAEAGHFAPADSWGSLGQGGTPIGPVATPGSGSSPLHTPAGTAPTHPSAGNTPSPQQPTPPTLTQGYAHTPSVPQTLQPIPSGGGGARLLVLGGLAVLFAGALIGGIVLAVVMLRGAPAPASPPPVPSPPAVPPTASPVPTPATPAATSSAAALPFAGHFTIDHSTNPGSPSGYHGSVLITHHGDLFHITWTIPGAPAYQGIGIADGDLLGVGWGTSKGYGVIVYDVDGGKLDGRWAANTTTSGLGTEVLQGPPGLDGSYQIVSAHPPDSTKSYTGVVTIHPTGATYQLHWRVESQSFGGVGILKGHTLAVGWGPQGAVVLYERGDQRLEGTWAQPGGRMLGTEVLRPL